MAKGNWVKSLLTGVAGGVIALSGGVAYQTIQGGHLSTTGTTTTNVKQVSTNVTTDTTSAVKKVKNAVVSVLNYQSGGGNSIGSSNSQLASEGSGVIYKKDGNTAYVVTNNHVIAENSSLEVLFANGKHVKATVVGSDSFSDLAVLKIDASEVTTTATFGDSSKLNVGEPAIAVGSPLGSEYANTATEGIVSSLSRQVTMQNEQGQTTSINAIQTDAAINPGNSGGALINIEGQVIGITSSKISSTSAESGGVTVEGMGFAIPSNDVITIIDKLEKNGKIERPALGIEMISLASLPQSITESLHLPHSVTNGVVVAEVESGLPADTAGVEKNDVITKIGDTAVGTSTDLQTALYKYNIGDTIKLTLYRGSNEKTISVKLTKSTSDLHTNSSQGN